MKLVYLRDEHGNLCYPKPTYVEHNGRLLAIEHPPLHIYVPVPDDELDGQPVARKMLPKRRWSKEGL